jgi:F0F1-type ATP synthase, alpha subunit
MPYTIIVAASAADPAPMQFYAPFTGAAIGEYFRDTGGTELEFVIMVIAVSCVKLLSAHNSTQHTSRKHKV